MKTFVDKQVKEVTEVFNIRRNRRSGKEEEFEIIVESGDESDSIKHCENCIGNEDMQTCTEFTLNSD